MSNDDGFQTVKISFESLKFTKIIQSSRFFTIKLISRLIQSYQSYRLIISKLLPGYIMGYYIPELRTQGSSALFPRLRDGKRKSIFCSGSCFSMDDMVIVKN